MRTEFELASGRIAALDVGEGPTVLFVPGYTGSKEDFMPLLRPLAGDGFHSVAIDQRGQYESAWARSAAGYSLAALAADVCELAAILRENTSVLHLVGHSFGGLVTRAAVISRPDLFTSFTLMGSGPAAIEGPRRAMLDSGESVLAEYGMSGLWQGMSDRAQTDPQYRQSPPALLAFLRARFMANDPVGLLVMGQTLREASDETAALAATGLRMLVLHGAADDAWAPDVQAEMAQRLGAVHAVIAAAAHSPAVENPGDTRRALVEFWRAA